MVARRMRAGMDALGGMAPGAAAYQAMLLLNQEMT